MTTPGPFEPPSPHDTPSVVPVAVVVVNYGSHELLAANLMGFGPEIDVVVVDNFHSTSEREAVTRLCNQHGWKLLANPTNSGFGSAVNAGIGLASEAGASVVLLINPDASISPGGLADLVADCVREPTVLVGPRIVRPDGSTWFQGGRILMDQGRTAMADLTKTDWPDGWLTGACLAIPVEFWMIIGGFDDDYFMYWEDVDLSQKWREAGGTLKVRGDVIAVHSVGGTQVSSAGESSDRAKSGLYYRYNCRNRLLFAAKHLDGPQLRIWMRGTLPYARAVLLRGGRRQFLRHPVMPLLAAARGSFEGYRTARRRLRELR